MLNILNGQSIIFPGVDLEVCYFTMNVLYTIKSRYIRHFTYRLKDFNLLWKYMKIFKNSSRPLPANDFDLYFLEKIKSMRYKLPPTTNSFLLISTSGSSWSQAPPMSCILCSCHLGSVATSCLITSSFPRQMARSQSSLCGKLTFHPEPPSRAHSGLFCTSQLLGKLANIWCFHFCVSHLLGTPLPLGICGYLCPNLHVAGPPVTSRWSNNWYFSVSLTGLSWGIKHH